MSTGKRPTGPRTTRAATKKAAKTAPPAKRRSGRQAAAKAETQEENGHRTVSYTHLTLPTICSV